MVVGMFMDQDPDLLPGHPAKKVMDKPWIITIHVFLQHRGPKVPFSGRFPLGPDHPKLPEVGRFPSKGLSSRSIRPRANLANTLPNPCCLYLCSSPPKIQRFHLVLCRSI